MSHKNITLIEVSHTQVHAYYSVKKKKKKRQTLATNLDTHMSKFIGRIMFFFDERGMHLGQRCPFFLKKKRGSFQKNRTTLAQLRRFTLLTWDISI